MIPLRDENPSRTTPVVTRALIALNSAFFLYEFLLGPQLEPFIRTWGMVPARVSLSLAGRGDPLPVVGFTFLSSMFLHGGWMHLIGNMWFLAIFGDNIEDRFGHFGYLIFYLASGLVAAGLQYFVAPQSGAPTVGASGAIAGVLGAYAIAYPGAKVVTLIPLFPFFQVVALPALVLLGFWFVLQFFSGALSLGAHASGGVAWWAHVGGFGFGALMMLIFGRSNERASRAWVSED
ncbi:MAG TPA: rhomboid family intramembrane serine protease [Candidatus Sulfotelmatobacter sp.]|nr:rhomboid family intramembrane serine protease [Candidatus Sulfotelmatobacter sp.]